MPAKFASFLRQSWFPLLTMIGMAIHGYYTMNYAYRDNAREISELQAAFSNMNAHGSMAMRDLHRQVQVVTNETVALKDFVFRMERRMNRFERNQDRITWVVEEIARKNGITPPKSIPEPSYE